jgi:hypothetical protein
VAERSQGSKRCRIHSHRDQPVPDEAIAAKNCVILVRMRWRETTSPCRKSTESGDAMVPTHKVVVMVVRID